MAAPSLLPSLTFREPQVLLCHLESTCLGLGHGEWARHRLRSLFFFFFFNKRIKSCHCFGTAKRSNQSVLKEINSENSMEEPDAEAEAAILRPPDVKNRLIGKDTDAGKD